ncbi:MAG: hypothetical protein ACP5XB_24090 [Isosphaeraceae bacterium]
MTLLFFALASLGQAPPAVAIIPPRPAVSLLALGADDAPGVLINYTVGVPPFAAPDPSRFSVVIVHGINPFHPLVHLEMAQRYGEAVGAVWGPSVNVLGWDWNANTMQGPFPARNAALAERQGRLMAEALLRAGLAPERLHLVGQSSGCIVAASAARVIADRYGRTAYRLTLLDPRTGHHTMVFETLRAGSAARIVDHLWVTGPSGFGSNAPYANVRNVAVIGPSGWSGFLSPGNLDHMQLVQWHIRQIAANPWGL